MRLPFRFPIRVKLFATLFCFALLAALVIALEGYMNYRSEKIDSLRGELMATARTVASQIDGDLHSTLTQESDEAGPAYRQIKEQLRKARGVNPRIRYIYTMVKTSRENVWEFVVDAEENPKLASHIGDEYDVGPYPEMQRGFDYPSADRDITEDKWGKWLSGYAPIRDEHGRSVAIVGLDMSARDVALAIEREGRRLLAAGTLVFFILTLVSLLLAETVLKPLKKITDAANGLASGELDHRIEVKANDEIADLAEAFNVMADRLAQRVSTAEHMAIVDGLTTLYNHQYFKERLAEEIRRASRYNRPLAMLFCDIDNFKAFNDRNGHVYGDAALRAIAKCIRAVIRDIDIAARYGGEEFALALPETTETEAIAVAERIRHSIATFPFPAKGGPRLGVTISIGAAMFPDDALTAEELVAAADFAMYRAKMEGKDRVNVYDVGLTVASSAVEENAEQAAGGAKAEEPERASGAG